MTLHACRADKSSSITTELVTSKRAMAGVSQLWRKVYAEEFNWSLNDPETDGYHERSTYYLAWLNDNIPAGTIRIVSAQNQGFHITDSINISEILTKSSPNFIEVQRLMVCEEHRDERYLGAPFGIYGCMVKSCLHHVIAHSIDTIIADCHVNMKISPMKSMLQMGFIDTGKTYIDELNGEVCAVLTINTATWLRNTYNRPTPFNRYLLDFDEWSIVQPNLHSISQPTLNEQLSSVST